MYWKYLNGISVEKIRAARGYRTINRGVRLLLAAVLIVGPIVDAVQGPERLSTILSWIMFGLVIMGYATFLSGLVVFLRAEKRIRPDAFAFRQFAVNLLVDILLYEVRSRRMRRRTSGQTAEAYEWNPADDPVGLAESFGWNPADDPAGEGDRPAKQSQSPLKRRDPEA